MNEPTYQKTYAILTRRQLEEALAEMDARNKQANRRNKSYDCYVLRGASHKDSDGKLHFNVLPTESGAA